MKSKILLLSAGLFIIVLAFSSCKKPEEEIPEKEEALYMNVVSSTSLTVNFKMTGTGYLTIDWGDGTPEEPLALEDSLITYKHNYSTSGKHTIKMKGGELTMLECDGNKIESLDVSYYTQLTYLNCVENLLKELNVSKNTQLTKLYCSVNSLTSLDVSKNTLLTELYCWKNNLTKLNVSKNTRLFFFVMRLK
jgi:Leucine-rich repeat (LRR) protein